VTLLTWNAFEVLAVEALALALLESGVDALLVLLAELAS